MHYGELSPKMFNLGCFGRNFCFDIYFLLSGENTLSYVSLPPSFPTSPSKISLSKPSWLNRGRIVWGTFSFVIIMYPPIYSYIAPASSLFPYITTYILCLKVFILPRVAELFIHKEKQRGCPLLGANRYTHIYISAIYVYIYYLFVWDYSYMYCQNKNYLNKRWKERKNPTSSPESSQPLSE